MLKAPLVLMYDIKMNLDSRRLTPPPIYVPRLEICIVYSINKYYHRCKLYIIQEYPNVFLFFLNYIVILTIFKQVFFFFAVVSLYKQVLCVRSSSIQLKVVNIYILRVHIVSIYIFFIQVYDDTYLCILLYSFSYSQYVVFSSIL